MKIKLAALVLLAVTLTGCKSTANYDYDQSVNFSALKTYAWIISDNKVEKSQEFFQSDINHKRIIRAIDQQLLAKGFEKVAPENAELLVNFHTSTITKRERGLSNTHPYFLSFGHMFHHSHLGMHMSLNHIERKYKAGSLVVDFVDANKELVWRGAKETRMKRKAAPAAREESVRVAVAHIMENFPPKN